MTVFLFDCRVRCCSLMSSVLSSAAVLKALLSLQAQIVASSLNDCMEHCSVLLITIASMSALGQAMLIFVNLLIAMRVYPAILLCALSQ